MGVREYRVLAAANGLVNGEEVETGDLVLLTPAQALYELDLLRVEPTGAPIPPPTPDPLDPDILETDLLLGLRDIRRNTISVEALERFLTSEGRTISEKIAGLIAAIGFGDITGLSAALAEKASTTALSQAQIALTDLIEGVAAAAAGHAGQINNPHGVTKAQVGLGNVANLAPADLPVSTAQAQAIAAAVAAKDSAVAAKTGAETARTAAESARSAAQAAQTGAETARTGAQTARSEAIDARSGAQAAQSASEAAKSAAQAARSEAASYAALVGAAAFDFSFDTDPTPLNDWSIG